MRIGGGQAAYSVGSNPSTNGQPLHLVSTPFLKMVYTVSCLLTEVNSERGKIKMLKCPIRCS